MKNKEEILNDIGLDSDNEIENSQEQDQSVSQEENQKENIKKQKVQEFTENQKQRGVVYLSRIPPYMKVNYIKKLLEPYGIERVYLVPEMESNRKLRQQTGGNKSRCYNEGWVEFTDKKIAKLTALSLNSQKMVSKKGSFYSDDLWCMKYLPKFKWDNLTQKFAYDQRMRKEKLKIEMNQSKKEHEFYQKKQDESKQILGMRKRKLQQLEKKGLAQDQEIIKKQRIYSQKTPIMNQNQDQDEI